MSIRAFLPGWLCLWIFLTGVHPGLGQSSWEKALQLAEAGREEEARTLLLELARNQPQNENVQALLGHIAFNGKDYQEAVQRFSLSPSVLATNPSLLVNYAVALLEMKESETARRVLEKIPHQNGIAQFEAAVLLAQLEDYEGAEKHFRLAWRNHPERGIVGYNLAYVQYHLGKFNDSAATLEDTRRDLANSDILNLLALSYIDLEQYEKALNILQEAINKDPLDQRHYVAVAKLCVEGQMPLVGLELLDQGISRLPDAFPLRLQRAYLRLLQSQYQDAELDYRAALQLQPGQGSPRLGLAFVFMASQRYDGAKEVLKETIELSPANSYAHYLLGELSLVNGAPPGSEAENQAFRHLMKAVELEPRFALAHASLGKLYLRRSDLETAVKELEKTIKLDPRATAAYYQLSIAYRKLGQKEKAQKALREMRLLNQQERKLGPNRFLYQRLRSAGEGVLFPR